MDAGTIATVASIIAGFSATMLTFRLQREIEMERKGEITWVPWADWLLVASVLVCLLLAIVPMAFSASTRLPSAAIGSAAVLVAGYPMAILAHYRLIFRGSREQSRNNPEPPECALVALTFAGATVFFLERFFCAA